VIVSASGMCEGGRVLHHLKHNIEDPRSTILIAGYQAADTLGRRLVERRPEVCILGRMVSLKAEVVVLNELSSHADHSGLVRSLEPSAQTAQKVRPVHGEMERAQQLAEALRRNGVAIPEREESVTF
jgi:metallo-beta-lactamase family protein